MSETYLTVGELKKQLENFPDCTKVVIQIDPEGNGYRHVRGTDDAIVEKIQYRYGLFDVYDPSWSHEDADMLDEEWAAFKQRSSNLVVIFP